MSIPCFRLCCLWVLLRIIETAVVWRRCTTQCWQGATRPVVKLCCTIEHNWESEMRTAGTSHTRFVSLVYTLKHNGIMHIWDYGLFVYMCACMCPFWWVFVYNHTSFSLFWFSFHFSIWLLNFLFKPISIPTYLIPRPDCGPVAHLWWPTLNYNRKIALSIWKNITFLNVWIFLNSNNA